MPVFTKNQERVRTHGNVAAVREQQMWSPDGARTLRFAVVVGHSGTRRVFPLRDGETAEVDRVVVSDDTQNVKPLFEVGGRVIATRSTTDGIVEGVVYKVVWVGESERDAGLYDRCRTLDEITSEPSRVGVVAVSQDSTEAVWTDVFLGLFRRAR